MPDWSFKMIFRFFLATLLVLYGCGANKHSEKIRIGVDSSWENFNFGPQTGYVNGFTEDLLQEIAKYEGVVFEKIPANWDTLFSGLKEKKYDAILTGLPPYTFNLAKYDFSQNILDLGPVLIVREDAGYKKLSEVGDRAIGVLSGDSLEFILDKYPDIRVKSYPSIPDLLNAAVYGDVAGVLLDRLPAVNYVADLYSGKLKIVSGPLSRKGLRLATLKGTEKGVTQIFNRSLKALKKKKKILLKKWSL